MTPRRYLVSTRANPLDASVRLERGADDDTLDAAIAAMHAKREPGECVVMIDFNTGARCVVEADGRRVDA